MQKIIIISDTHRRENEVKLPEGDILIHAGDFDIRSVEDLTNVNAWFGKQQFKHKITIVRNHDLYCEKLNPFMIEEILTNVIYLHNNSVEIEGIKIWDLLSVLNLE